MKKLFKFLGALFVLVVIAVGFVVYLTSGMTDVATAFFSDIREKNYDKAYELLAEEFQASTPKASFLDFIQKSSLLHIKDTSWDSRSVSGKKGELEGSVTTETGGTVPVKLTFIKENGGWKIYSITRPKAGLLADDTSQEIPNADQLVQLIDASMLKFAQAIDSKDFSDFYSYISNLWRKQIDVAKLNEAFKPLMKENVKWEAVIRSNSPVVDGDAAIDDQGMLVINGHYPTRPSKLNYKLGYVYEGTGWKLASIYVYATR